MCVALLFYTHQHFSSSSVIHMLLPFSSVELFFCSCASVCLHKSSFFSPVILVCLGECYFVSIIPSVYVGEVFPTSPQFVFGCFLIPNDTCYWWTSFVLCNTFVVTVNSYLVHSNSTTYDRELHIAGLNGKNVTLEVKNIAAKI